MWVSRGVGMAAVATSTLPVPTVCRAPPPARPALAPQFGAGAAMADQRALDILGEAYCK